MAYFAVFAAVTSVRKPATGSPEELIALQQRLQSVSDQQCKGNNGQLGLPLFHNPRIVNGRVTVDVGHDSGWINPDPTEDEKRLRRRFGKLVDVHEYGAGGQPACAIPVQ